RHAPEGVAPGPDRWSGDARAARGEGRDPALLAAGHVELVDRAALVEERARAARVDDHDRPRGRSRPEVDLRDLVERPDGRVGGDATGTEHEPLDLAAARA